MNHVKCYVLKNAKTKQSKTLQVLAVEIFISTGAI